MKSYDFKKAKAIIEENKDILESASLGMHEDWYWTAETIWEDGEFKRELLDNSEELEELFIAKSKEGLRMLSNTKDENGLSEINADYKKYSAHRIAGLYSSGWATPTIQLIFKDGSEKMMPCHNNGESNGTKPTMLHGVLSGPVQETITPLSQQ